MPEHVFVRDWPISFYLASVVLVQTAHHGARDYLCAPRCLCLLLLADKKEALPVKLPTEAEWEKAAGGEDGRLWPWGNSPTDCDKAHYMDCVGRPGVVTSHPDVGSPYGASDMAGNSREWVADWYAGDYCSLSPDRNPWRPDSGDHGVVRDGSFRDDQGEVRCVCRLWHHPLNQDVGFRVVVAPGPSGP